MIDRYTWDGGSEAMLRFGADSGPVVIAALPLFEEANRTRTFTVTLLRHLARLGIGSLLPDLPGQGESLVPTDATTLAEMRHAFAALAVRCRDSGRRPYALAIRSGALIDAEAEVLGRWHFAPQEPSELARELERVLLAAARETHEAPARLSGEALVEVAGNPLSARLQAELRESSPQATAGRRIVRLATDAAPADLKLDGPPLWRRAEPDNDPALARLLAEDIVDWIRTCEG